MLDQLRADAGPDVDGARLDTRRAARKYEAVCYYDRDRPGSMEYAFRCRRFAKAERSQPLDLPVLRGRFCHP